MTLFYNLWRIDADLGTQRKHRFILATCIGCYTQHRIRADGVLNGTSTRCKTCAIAGGGSLDERIAMRSRVEANGCVLWTGHVRGKGYPMIDADGGRISVHRYVLERFIGRPLAVDEIAMHGCDTPRCINADHLRVGTTADNVADCIAKGRRRYLSGAAWRIAHMPGDRLGQRALFGAEP